MPTSKAGTLEDRLEERVRFEQLITDLTASLVSVSPKQLESALDSVLVRICRQFGADHCGLVEIPADGSSPRFVSLTDRKEKQQKGMKLDPVSGSPWSHRRLVERGEPILFSSLNSLPPEAAADRAFWTQEETQSALALPLRVGGKVTHVIGLRSHRSGKEWPADHVERLRVLGEIIAHVLTSQRAHDEIKRLKDLLESENIYLREEMQMGTGFAGIIGDSNPIKYVQYRIRKVARTKTTVLLTGETGTGKGLFARALHEASDRRQNLFVHVNCAGLPPTLIESELFGSEKGAYTSSAARQIGRFELADGGTLFLDEIGELPLDLQAKLLKVIEHGEFERVGSPHPIRANVRILASTNRFLEEEVRKGTFRMDLFYRLNVFPITIPPLRQRKEDIPLLVKFFADRFSRDHAKRITSIPHKSMTALRHYDWPGNVRELMNVVERAVIISEGPALELAEQLNNLTMTVKETGSPPGMEEFHDIRGLSEMEREHILHTLRKTGWRIEGERGAARILGINPSTMRARMKKLHIRRPGSS